MLFCACDSACWPFVWVMAVGVGVSGFWWRVFQWCVAVVLASSVVPGVVVGFGVWVVCSGVGVGVCVSWFRMLMCVLAFLSCFWFCFLFVLFVWLITVGVPGGGVGVGLGCFCLCLLAWRESGPVGMWGGCG